VNKEGNRCPGEKRPKTAAARGRAAAACAACWIGGGGLPSADPWFLPTQRLKPGATKAEICLLRLPAAFSMLH
jgi:hypothetical protein